MGRISKKSILISLLIFAVGCITGFFVHPVVAHNYNVQVEVNGKTVQFDDGKPFIENGRTLIPIRYVAEKLGATVYWNKETKTVSIKKTATTPDSDAIILKIGSKQAYVGTVPMNGQLDVAAFIEKDRTMVPLRFVSESLGYNVLWDKYNNIAKISDQPFVATGKELTAEQKQRLMGYGYPKDENGKEYPIYYRMVDYKEYLLNYMGKDYDTLKKINEAIAQLNVLKSNQKFITDPDLRYSCNPPVGDARIRGILQNYESDGTITEQDIEYGFDYGEEIVSAVAVMEGKATTRGSHWFEEYDTKALSKVKVVEKK